MPLDRRSEPLPSQRHARWAQRRPLGVAGYAPGSKNKLVAAASGDGGVGRLRERLLGEPPIEGGVSFGVLPVRVDGRTRRVFLTFIGEGTSAIKRGRASLHAPHVERFLDGTIGALPVVEGADDLSDTQLLEALRRLCSGARLIDLV